MPNTKDDFGYLHYSLRVVRMPGARVQPWVRLPAGMLPITLFGALVRWIEEHTEPGQFLSSVLKNDLLGAVCRADVDNYPNLGAIAKVVKNHAPEDCHGSVAKFDAWLKAKPLPTDRLMDLSD